MTFDVPACKPKTRWKPNQLVTRTEDNRDGHAQTFDDRDGWIWLDGRMVEWRDAKVHILTHALHYASAVFEGERAYGGRVFKSAEHSDRLKDFRPAFSISRSRWTVLTRSMRPKAEVLRRNGFTFDAYLRPVAWRGSEMMGVTAQHNTIHLGNRRLGLAELFRPRRSG